jgi:hypothetical protein
MHAKCCEANKSTIPPKEYGERCLDYLEQKFVSSGAELQQLTPSKVLELRELEQTEGQEGDMARRNSVRSSAVVTEGPKSAGGSSSPLHCKVKQQPTTTTVVTKTPAPDGVPDVYHSTAV